MTREKLIALTAALLIVGGLGLSVTTAAQSAPEQPEIDLPSAELPDLSFSLESSVESVICPGAYDVERTAVSAFDPAAENLNVTWSDTAQGWSQEIENRTEQRREAIRESEANGTCEERYL